MTKIHNFQHTKNSRRSTGETAYNNCCGLFSQWPMQMQMLYSERLDKLLFSFFSLPDWTLPNCILQRFPAPNSCSHHQSFFSSPHLLPLYRSFPLIFLHFSNYTTTSEQIFFPFSSLFIPFIFFFHLFSPQLHSSNPHRVVSISISQYVSPTWRIILLHSFLLSLSMFLWALLFCCHCCIRVCMSQNRSWRFGCHRR